jgi:hypothetical protein
MTSYSKSTIINYVNINGVVVYNSTLIFANYGDNCLYSVPENSNSATQLGSSSAVATLGSIGIYGNKIYAFSAMGYIYNYYTIGSDFADILGFGMVDPSIANIKALGNMYLSDENTAYVASSYQNSSDSFVYKITGITGTIGSSVAVTISLGTTCNVGGVTSNGTYLYIAYVDVTNSDVRVFRVPISGLPITITSGNYSSYSFCNISAYAVSSPERCDCFYFDNKLYVMSSSTSITNIYAFTMDGQSSIAINDGNNANPTINAGSNTFTVGKSSYGIKIFVSTNKQSHGYDSLNSGYRIDKLYPTTAPLAASIGGDPHIKPIFSDITYIIPNTLNCYNYFDSSCISDHERFIINSKLWIIDYNFIANMTDINDEIKINNNIKYDNINATDSGFNRYISLIYKYGNDVEYLIIDTESLFNVEYDPSLIDKYELKNTDKKYKFFELSEIDEQNDKYKKKIFLNTDIFGKISIILTKHKYRKNHRNDFDIVFENTYNLRNSKGVIVNENELREVPNLLYVENDTKKCYNMKLSTIDEHKELIRQSNLPKMKKIVMSK